MFTRPFLPFRVRPLRAAKARAALAAPIDVIAELETLKPLSVKAERRSVRGLPVATAGRSRVPVRAVTRLG